jgi:hypothetical protein
MNLSEREQLIMALPEGDFTRITAEKSKDIGDDYCDEYNEETEQSLFFSNKTYEEIIDYLRDTSFTMTYGYALKRLVINKFNLHEDSADDEIAEILYREFKGKGVPILNRKSRKPSKKDEIEGIKSWLGREESDSHVDRKKFLNGISFALEMSDIQVSHFLRKELGEQDYNFRDPEEIIAFYCHYNGYGYDKYAQLLKKYDSIQVINDNKEVQRNYTAFFEANYNYYFSDDDSLLKFLGENKGEFIKIRQSTIEHFRDSWYMALEKAKELNALKQSNDKKHRKSGVKKQSDEIKEDEFYRTFCDYLPARGGNKSIVYSTKGSSLKNIVSNPLINQRVHSLLGETNSETSEYIYGSAEAFVTKKDLVTVEFYIFCIEREIKIEKKEPIDYYEDYERFVNETDIMLFKNGFFKLYPGNRFDNLILISLMNADCWNFWKDVLDESFGFDEG